MKNLLVVLFLLVGGLIFGQTFERTYGEDGRDEGYAVIEGEDGNFYACGRNHEGLPFLMKTDEFGVEEWETTYGLSGSFSIIRKVNSNHLIVGSQPYSEPILVMYDTEGIELWSYDFNEEQQGFLRDIEIDADGNLVVLISLVSSSSEIEDADYIIMTISSSGELISEYVHTNIEQKENSFDILLLEAGGYLTIGRVITKFSENFEVEWIFENNWTYLGDEIFNGGAGDLAVELDDGSFFIAYTGYDNGVIDGKNYLKFISLDTEGQLLWDAIPFEQSFDESPSYGPHYSLGNIAKIDNQSIILVGQSGYNWQANTQGKLSLIKVDTQGNFFWNKNFGGSGIDTGKNVCVTSDNSFIAVGFASDDFDYDSRQTYIIKTDSTGTLIKNNINGTISFDENENCTEDNEEIGLKNWLVTAATEENIYYDITDTTGFYELNVDNGNYNVFVTAPNQYWNNCEPLFNTGNLEDYDTLTNDFHVQAAVDCPEMRVDVSTPLLRRCFDTYYNISYSNQGTLPTENAFIEVTFDEYLEITGSNPPWNSQNGQTLTYELTTVDVQEYGTIQVDVTVGCDEEGVELGQIHCVEAYIYPDTICAPANPSWDGSDIIVDADCENDSVRFFIRNIGEGDMDSEQEYIIIEDHIILLQEPFQLPAGGEIEIPVPTDGIAYRLEAEQSAGHPIGNMPSINVEGCNTTGANDFILGFWNEYPEDDVANFVSIDCQSNIGSYDPNDKRSQPAGYGEDNLIAQNTDIEYHIRFQNTGTDTAFTVVIEDVLSSALDITSIVPGASSHPYEFDIENGRKLKFTFNDILLVDSTTNEVASHGYVKFKVSQMPDNPTFPWPTRIYNKANIFFDFNAPITTNQTRLTVGRHFIENYISSAFEVTEEEKRVLVHPNPFSEETTFTVKGITDTPLEFTLFDIQGRELRRERHHQKSFKFLRKGLAEGLYFYRIETDGRLLDAGKIVIK